MIDKNIILLIDFEGHPILGDEYMNNLRYSYLNSTLYGFGDLYPDKSFLIFSDNHDQQPKISEVEKITNADGQHQWITIDPDAGLTYEDIINLAEVEGYNINKVIIGGCNTTGCVLKSTGYSAIQWAKAGYDVIIYLPMCADYQVGGVNTIEKNLHAFTLIYKTIKEENLIDKIDIPLFLESEVTEGL